MADEQYDIDEALWKSMFGIFACVLIAVLFDLAARAPTGIERALCLIFGMVSVVVCICAARKLRREDRVPVLEDAGDELPSLDTLADLAADADD